MRSILITFLLLFLSASACGKPIVYKSYLHSEIETSHTSVLSYTDARKYLFGQLHYNNGVVTDVYCGQDHKADEGVGPGRIPDPKFLNCEHTWPQSKFGSKDVDTKKTDLHHLFPVTSSSNSSRSNHPYNNVVGNPNVCGKSKLGKVSDVTSFEPPDFHKGNVARAMFYFSTRYSMPIDPAQEAALRKWNKLDPVDAFEMSRNTAIEKIQGNRNPFIDDPTKADQIKDF